MLALPSFPFSCPSPALLQGKGSTAFLVLRSGVQLPQLSVFYSVLGFGFKLVAETLICIEKSDASGLTKQLKKSLNDFFFIYYDIKLFSFLDLIVLV